MARLTSALALALALSGAWACGSGSAPPRAPSVSPPAPEVASNVLFADYAGSKACASCHQAEFAAFMSSPMHNMTRDAATARFAAPFDGTVFAFKGDTARLETSGSRRFISLGSSRFGSGTYLVTRVIGGHHREDYVGVLVTSPSQPTPLVDPPEEVVLPVSYVFATKSLRYKGYSVMVKERPGLRVGPVWKKTCIFCHNTAPHLTTILGALAGPTARAYQGEVVDPLLPPTKRSTFTITDRGSFEAALGQELTRLGAPSTSHPTAAEAIEGVRSHFDRSHLVELGIGCESCHLGSAAHVQEPRTLPSFEPRSPFLSVKYPLPPEAGVGALRAARVNRACARCHQVLFSGYEPTWEGGSRRTNPGGSNMNSGEARDMLLGACASKLTCVECHDPHAHDGTAKLRSLPRDQENRLCTRCHEKLSDGDAVRAHTHHDPTGAGSACLACHMPKKNMSLDGGLSRYHRIGSPTDSARVLLDRPIECALCHADKSVESLVSTMERWWKRAFDRGALERLYGSVDANVMQATAERGKPHEQAVAFHILGDARRRAAIPVLATQLTHPYPIVRSYAKRALDSIEGRAVPIDIDAADDVIERQTKAWLGR